MTEQSDKKRVNLNPTQVVAGGLASVTAAVAASKLGVGGTLVGAGVGSVVATVGGAVYEHYLDRTRHQVRSVVLRRPGENGRPVDEHAAGVAVPVAVDPTQELTPSSLPPSLSVPAESVPAESVPAESVPAVPAESVAAESAESVAAESAPEWVPADTRGAPGDSQPTWAWLRSRRLALGVSALAGFGIALGALTGFEAATGKSVSATVNGTDETGTSVGRVFGGGTSEETTEPTTTPSPSATTSVEPTPTPTATLETATPTPSVTVEPTTPVPTSEPTVTAPPPSVPAG